MMWHGYVVLHGEGRTSVAGRVEYAQQHPRAGIKTTINPAECWRLDTVVKYLDSNTEDNRKKQCYTEKVVIWCYASPGLSFRWCLVLGLCGLLVGPIGLIVGVSCLLCSSALPGVWSFLRVTQECAHTYVSYIYATVLVRMGLPYA